MKRYTGILLDASGNPKPSSSIKVVYADTTTVASLFLDGVAIANPITTDPLTGTFVFDVFSGVYDFLDSGNSYIQRRVQIFDESTPSEWLAPSQLKLAPTSAPFTDVQGAIDALLLGTGAGSSPLSQVTAQTAGIPIVAQSGAATYISRFRIPYTTIASIGGAGTVATALIAYLPPRTVIDAALVELVTPFAATGLTNLQVNLGGKASYTITPPNGVSMFGGTKAAGFVQPFLFTGTSGTGITIDPENTSTGGTAFSTPREIWIGVVTTGANCNALTAGVMDISIFMQVVP